MGSKAANLARLHHQGLPVPEGFCIPSDVIENADWTEPVLEAYRRLVASRNDRVAVRSSALAEDLAEASFAGQYETFLNIEGEAALLDAIRQCQASDQAARVAGYKAHHEMTATASNVSVLVQRMVAADMAGVLFTSDPVSGSSDRIVIEAVPNVAEELVSGTVTPAHIVLDRGTKSIAEAENLSTLPAPLAAVETWSRLLDLALQIEAVFTTPQDIEWAYQDGQFWILQSRPISVRPAAIDMSRLTRANIGEVLPGVVTPLTISTFLHALQASEAEDQDVKPSEMLTIVEGRAYIDVQLLWNSYDHIVGLRPPSVLKKGLGCDVTGREAELAAASPPIGISGNTLKSAYVWLELVTRRWVKPRIERLLTQEIQPTLDQLNARSLQTLTQDDIWQQVQQLLKLTNQAFSAHMQSSFIALCAYAIAHDRLAIVAGEQNADRLMSAASANQTANAAALHHHFGVLAKRVQASPALDQLFRSTTEDDLLPALQADAEGQRLLAEIEQSAHVLGNRGVQEFELNTPRWAEDPRLLIATLRALLLSGALETGSGQSHDAEAVTLDSCLQRVSPVQRLLVRHIYQTFVAYAHTREQTKSVLMTCFSELRRHYLQLATMLQQSAALTEADDIFFLEISELNALLNQQVEPSKLTSRIPERRRAHERYTSQGAAAGFSADPDAQVLIGTAVSGGQVTGRARVVSNPALAALENGDILIAEYTDPGWTPLFLIASAVVTEIGGILSHTGTLARELNKPAVFSIAGATRLIQDGQRITVDGSSGKIYLHPD